MAMSFWLKKSVFVIFLLGINAEDSSAQKSVKTFIFGHSLIHHEFQVNPTPSQETSVPHWFHFLAIDAGNDYTADGQYGFLLQHANLPPISQWGFDFVPGSWESDTEPFSAADFTNILITPANFVQWQAPDINYPGESTSPIDATITIIDWCNQQEESLDFFIYENWPDMAQFLSNDFPPSESEWNEYLEYLNNDFHNWFLEYYETVKSNFPNSCVRMIPVGPVINNLMKVEPFNQIPISELFEDDAPHGRAPIYFLASIATYMAMYEEKPSIDYEVEEIIHPIIRDNYGVVVDYIWNELVDFKDEEDNLLAFCSEDISTSNQKILNDKNISIYPNPTNGKLELLNFEKNASIEIYDLNGNLLISLLEEDMKNNSIEVDDLPNGMYFLVVRDSVFDIVFADRIVKNDY